MLCSITKPLPNVSQRMIAKIQDNFTTNRQYCIQVQYMH